MNKRKKEEKEEETRENEEEQRYAGAEESADGFGVRTPPSSEGLPTWTSGSSLQMTTDSKSKGSQLKPLLASECCQLAVCTGIGGLNETQHSGVYLQIES